MVNLRILIADDQTHARHEHSSRLEVCARHVFRPIISQAATAEEAVSMAKDAAQKNEAFDLILMDIHFGEGKQDGHWAAGQINFSSPDCHIVIISTHPTQDNFQRANSNAAITRFFRRSYTDSELYRVAIWAALTRLHRDHKLVPEEHAIFTSSPRMNLYLRQLDQIAPESNAVLYGETGTGKELSARRLHANAQFELGQKGRPFVAVNCGAITPTLVESEMFGYVRGAFTGANTNKDGFLAKANGGDLFLDELQNAPLPFQRALMRAIQEKKFTPVGATQPVAFEARIISALNVNLGEARSAGTLMPDFIARLRQDMLEIPALRDRPEDTPLLIEIAKSRAKASDKEFSIDAVEFLSTLKWRENVRGFMSVCQAALSRTKLPIISADSLKELPAVRDILGAELTQAAIQEPLQGEVSIDTLAEACVNQDMSLADSLMAFEAAYLKKLVESNQGQSISKIARSSGMPATTLRRKLDEHKIVN